MATESSAVVRFINLAQQTHNPVRATAEAPVTSEFGTEVMRPVRAKRSRVPLVVGALVVAGGAAAGGLYLGKYGLGGAPDDSTALPAAAAAVQPAEAPAPVQAPPPAAAPAPAPEPAVAPIVTASAEVLAATGFDIRVQPGAAITLDGQLLGKAPLRVRNLQAGRHVIDIEAPAGYFSRRVELSLAAGEARELRVALDPIEEPAALAAGDDEEAVPAKKSRAELRRERREKTRAEKQRKKEMRAARADAARADKAARARGVKKSAVVTQALPDVAEPKASAADSAADAELEAAMADIVGKPRKGGAAPPSSSTGEPAGGKGVLMLGSKPPCDILVDGKPTGLKTPQRALELDAGTHRITLVNKELGLEKKFKVRIAPGKTTKAIQDLTASLD